MGNQKNVGYEIFPKQKSDLGSVVRIGKNAVEVRVVRSDSESPNRTIYMTSKGEYFEKQDLGNLTLPKQGMFLGRRTEVVFNYDASRTLEGLIVRDDADKPHITLIKLEDNRIISGEECQYSPDAEPKVNLN